MILACIAINWIQAGLLPLTRIPEHCLVIVHVARPGSGFWIFLFWVSISRVGAHLLQKLPLHFLCNPGPSPPVRPKEVDRTLQRQDSGVESVLLYAKAWSKYTKELLAWVEKRISVGELDHSGVSKGVERRGFQEHLSVNDSGRWKGLRFIIRLNAVAWCI